MWKRSKPGAGMRGNGKVFKKKVKKDGREDEEGGGLHKHWTQEFNHNEP